SVFRGGRFTHNPGAIRAAGSRSRILIFSVYPFLRGEANRNARAGLLENRTCKDNLLRDTTSCEMRRRGERDAPSPIMLSDIWRPSRTCNNRSLAEDPARFANVTARIRIVISFGGLSMFNFIKWPLATALLMGTLAAAPSAMARDGDRDGKIGHVFVIVLENEGFNKTFGPNSLAPFLSQALPSQ